MRTRWLGCAVLASVTGLAGLLVAGPVSADIIKDTSIVDLGQGFGANPRLLTVQQMGNSPNPAGTGPSASRPGAPNHAHRPKLAHAAGSSHYLLLSREGIGSHPVTPYLRSGTT